MLAQQLSPAKTEAWDESKQLPESYHKKAVERRHREQEDALRWVENTPPTHPLPTKSYTVKNKYGTREDIQKQHDLDTTFRGAYMRAGTLILEKMVKEELELWEEEPILKHKKVFELYVACLRSMF